MKTVQLCGRIALATIAFGAISSGAQADQWSKYRPQMYQRDTVTSTTRGGTIDLSRRNFVYGQSSTFNSGSNPRNDQTIRSVGVGRRF